MFRTLLMCLWVAWFTNAWAEPALEIRPDQPRTNLTPYLSVYEDRSGTLSAEQVSVLPEAFFKRVKGKRPNFGKSDSVWWLRIPLDVQTISAQGVLEVNYALLDQIQVFVVGADAILAHPTLGDSQPWLQRIVPIRDFWTPITLHHDDQQLLVRIQSTSTIYIPIYYTDVLQSAGIHELLNTFNGIFYGILLTLFIYNVAIFFSLREHAYGWFVVHSLSLVLVALHLEGFMFRLLPESMLIQHHATNALLCILSMSAVQFSRHYLDCRNTYPVLDKLLHKLLWAQMLLLVSGLWMPFGLWATLTSVSLLVNSAILLGVGFFTWQHSTQQGIFYLLAWTSLLVSFFLASGASLGITFLDTYGAHVGRVGIVLAAVLFSIGLAVRISCLREHSKNAQQQALHAQTASQAKSRFLAKVSHEIRTPLNGVLGMAELLKESSLAPTQRLYAETISQSGRSLLATINDILDYARIESGKLSLEAIDFDLDALLSESLAPFYQKACDKRLQLLLSVAPGVPTAIHGDPLRLKQVLLNLVDNAIKFTHVGFVHIEVSSQDGQLQFCVTDSGVGVEEEDLQRIFQPFDQAESSTSRRYGGSGLGLSICQELAQLMQGQLTVTSAPLQSSCFTLSVPLQPIHSALPDAPNDTYQVVVLCDNNRLFNALSLTLQRWSFTAVQCNLASELDACLARTGADVIVCTQAQPLMFNKTQPLMLINLRPAPASDFYPELQLVNLPSPVALLALRQALEKYRTIRRTQHICPPPSTPTAVTGLAANDSSITAT